MHNFHQIYQFLLHKFFLNFSGTKEKDNLPCDLCEQLVGHLKDVLIANTTEEEFDLVLQGLCKQTGQFTSECLSLVSQYYPEIYQYLVNHLNSTEVCTMIGICNPSIEKVKYKFIILQNSKFILQKIKSNRV